MTGHHGPTGTEGIGLLSKPSPDVNQRKEKKMSPAHRRYNLEDMLADYDRGVSVHEIANKYKVTEAAIRKSVKKHRPAPCPALDKLSGKKQLYALERGRGTNPTQSAMKVYDATPESARTIACRNEKDPAIREAIQEICDRQGMTREHLVKRVHTHTNSSDPGSSLRACELGLKLQGELIDRKVNLNINLDLVSPINLERFRNRLPEIEAEASGAVTIDAEEVKE